MKGFLAVITLGEAGTFYIPIMKQSIRAMEMYSMLEFRE